jgi:hypothetical protein
MERKTIRRNEAKFQTEGRKMLKLFAAPQDKWFEDD